MNRHAIELFSYDRSTGRIPLIEVQFSLGSAIGRDVWLPARINCPIPRRVFDGMAHRVGRSRQPAYVTQSLARALRADLPKDLPLADEEGTRSLWCDTAFSAEVLSAIAERCDSQLALQRYVVMAMTRSVRRTCGKAWLERQPWRKVHNWNAKNVRDRLEAIELRKLAGVE